MESIKLEAGKFYRTRAGRKAFVALVGCPFECHPNRQAVGWIEDTKSRFPQTCSWRDDGSNVDIDMDLNHDLVAEWVEPKRIKGWVAIKGNAQGLMWPDPHLHSTRLLAEKCSPSVVACIEIDVLEGQGLDGSASNG